MKIYTKHAARASFISGKMFNDNLFAINRIKEELVLDQFILGWQYLTYLNYSCMISIIITY